MKLSRRALYILSACLALLVSCKPQGIETNGPLLLGSFYAIVDNSYFEGMDNSGTLTDTSLSISGRKQENGAGSGTIQFSIPKLNGARTYEIDIDASASYTHDDTTFYARSGKIVVTSASPGSVVGTFTFKAEKDGLIRNISAGRFEMHK